MEKTKGFKVFACGEIASKVSETKAIITDEFENYAKINNYKFLGYFLKNLIEPVDQVENLVECINLYGKHKKSNEERLTKALEGLDTAIILANLRDENSIRNIETISKIAKDRGILVLAMVLIPYCADESEQLKYDTQMQSLSSKVDTIIPLLAERMAANSKVPLVSEDGIDFCESYMGFCLDQLVQFFEKGPVSLDKKDFNDIFKDSGLGFIAIGAGKGENKLEDALKWGAYNNRKITKCKKLLMSITSNEDMNLAYINNILERIQSAAGQDADIVFTAFKDNKLQDDLIITIIGIENLGVIESAYTSQKLINQEAF